MHLDRRIRAQLIVFLTISLICGAIMVFRYINLPAMLFGIGRYTVTVELPRAAGLYYHGNVTYRGTEVGRIKEVNLTRSGVEAVLSLNSGTRIPSDLMARVHSQSAAGEQYISLEPRNGDSPPLKNGDVITAANTSVPPDIDTLLDATNRGLEAIPRDNLRTVIDESYTAVGGLGPELTRLIKGSTTLAIDADRNLDSITTLIDQSAPVLNTQADTSGAIAAWAAHLNTITAQLEEHDRAMTTVVQEGGPAFDEARGLLERVQPTLPVLLANLVSLNKVALTYQPALEQLLVLLPQGVSIIQGASLADRYNPAGKKGLFLDFNLNLNLPPVCATGFLPPQQRRAPTFEDYPDRPAGDMYCRVPQDSPFGVRGARNYPCLSVPGKRAPSVKMCESDEQYVPLNDGYNWKGDPNATLTNQDVPQVLGAPGSDSPVPAVVAAAGYDPATGTYLAPNGERYTQTDLAKPQGNPTWQSMLMPGGG